MAHPPLATMDPGDRILNIVNIANHGAGLMKASEAVRVIADLIGRLDRSGESYAQETEALLRIGATVWRQQQRQRQRGGGTARKTRAPTR